MEKGESVRIYVYIYMNTRRATMGERKSKEKSDRRAKDKERSRVRE